MVFNLLQLHRLARNGDGLGPAMRALLARREAVETNAKVVILHPGISAGVSTGISTDPARGATAGLPGAVTAFRRER